LRRIRYLERIEERVDFLSVEDQASPLMKGSKTWAPGGVKRAALDAHVGHRFGVGQASFHRPVSCAGSMAAKASA
jgi:hypothetical protein